MKSTRILLGSTIALFLVAAGVTLQGNTSRAPGGIGPIRISAETRAALATPPNDTTPTKEQEADARKIAVITSRMLAEHHYAKKPVNDELSSQLLNRFLDTLDPQRLYFLKTDVAEFEKWRTSLDDMLWQGDTSPAHAIFARFKERFDTAVTFAKEELAKGPGAFTFTSDDEIVLDRKKEARPDDLEAAKVLWRQRLRYEYLQEKLNKTKPEEIVNTVNRRYARMQRTLGEYDHNDILEMYLTTLAHLYDPHSDYFGKATSENFEIGMKLSLFGIGARLTSEDGYTKIDELTPGGPAIKSGLLSPGDKIVAVGEGASGGWEDVVDVKLTKVVEKIRGPKGSTVRLRIIPADAADPSVRKVVTLVRDEIKLEDQGAKARLIEMPGQNGKTVRVGIIDLPLFYSDAETHKKSAAADMAKLLRKLQEQKVAGVILDLRNNGGGSLTEAIDVTGLFIKQGPVVQVKGSNGRVQVANDEDSKVVYSGPLVVLISKFSASASEIVAGALQDYNRALIVGDSSSSFGKGTVQSLIDLAEVMPRAGVETKDNPGSIKLTTQKFYRASGASTQLEGVKPDIQIPSVVSVIDVGEKQYDNPLKYDTIETAPYQKTNNVTPALKDTLRARSQARISKDRDFQYLVSEIARLKTVSAQKTISLNEATRLKEKQEAEARTAARQKVLAARPKPTETVYLITLADADKPGLPKPLTAKQLAELEAKGQVTGEDDQDPRVGTTEKKTDTKLRERDLTMDEAERILIDLAMPTATKPVPANAQKPVPGKAQKSPAVTAR